MHAPELTTERLQLRAHRVDDLDRLAAMWAAPEVVRYIGGVGLRREDVWSRLLRAVALAGAPVRVRVASKVGYREWCRTTYHGVPTVLLER